MICISKAAKHLWDPMSKNPGYSKKLHSVVSEEFCKIPLKKNTQQQQQKTVLNSLFPREKKVGNSSLSLLIHLNGNDIMVKTKVFRIRRSGFHSWKLYNLKQIKPPVFFSVGGE